MTPEKFVITITTIGPRSSMGDQPANQERGEKMSNLVEHAEREMRLAGLYDGDSMYGGMIPEAVMDLVKAHSKQGHSGGSHAMVMGIFKKVVDFKNLTPLTSDPSEWLDRTEMSGGNPTWQNIRNSSVFSKDGGKTWYDIDDPEKKNWPKQ